MFSKACSKSSVRFNASAELQAQLTSLSGELYQIKTAEVLSFLDISMSRAAGYQLQVIQQTTWAVRKVSERSK